ncbi:hypothetical protein [Methylobacterium sp. Leaf94]|uniref:hypothetical protein n=1 Tax=Methylobacterium sp. Leaf94 TaxID=1736250 RepID=UPI0012E38782|nr:hypothetical protein [Methylobacterium sp. Leaf94]
MVSIKLRLDAACNAMSNRHLTTGKTVPFGTLPAFDHWHVESENGVEARIGPQPQEGTMRRTNSRSVG